MYKAHIADRLLNAMDAHYPEVKELCRDHRRTFKDSLCMVPRELIHGYIFMLMCKSGLTSREKRKDLPYLYISSQLNALSNWRYTRSIYRFDESLYHELVSQPLDIVPMKLLYALPEPSMYIETTENPYTGQGFFAHFNFTSGAHQLILSFFPSSRLVLELPIHNGQSIQRMVANLLDNFSGTVDISSRRNLEIKCRIALNLLLYLCCENADYSGSKKPKKPSKWSEKKATVYRNIGFHIGKMLRQEQGEHEQTHKMKPHIRSAHWCTYWVGKRGEQTPILNWIAPIFVNQIEKE